MPGPSNHNGQSNPLVKYMSELIDLTKGLDREGTIVYIRNNRSVTGANAWLLLCSILIACVGLNLNSPAVIIGGMLISPLMSPILGVGLGVGINDRDLLLNSLYHFGISIVISLMGSFLYFKLSPLVEMTEEIRARISPTLLDTFVAFFGGLAGIISISRKEVSNAIPGVAIATALMPPLCVSGYGMATDNFNVFINSFYLFFLNSFFIAVSTFLMSRILDFPLRLYQDKKEQRRTTMIITTFSLIIILPSIHILYGVYDEIRTDALIKTEFIDEYFGPDDNPRAIDFKVLRNDDQDLQLMLEVYGKLIDEEDIAQYEKELSAIIKKEISLILLQDMRIDVAKINALENQIQSVQSFTQQIEINKERESALSIENRILKAKIDSLNLSPRIQSVHAELQLLYPEIQSTIYNHRLISYSMDSMELQTVVSFEWSDNIKKSERIARSERARTWLQSKLLLDSLILE